MLARINPKLLFSLAALINWVVPSVALRRFQSRNVRGLSIRNLRGLRIANGIGNVSGLRSRDGSGLSLGNGSRRPTFVE
jgi:hypothetical protein